MHALDVARFSIAVVLLAAISTVLVLIRPLSPPTIVIIHSEVMSYMRR